MSDFFLGIQSPFDSARFLIDPIAYEGNVSWVSGTSKGPEAIISASEELEFYDAFLGVSPSNLGIHTLQILKPSDFPSSVINRTIKLGQKFCVHLGGDHSISIPIFESVCRVYGDVGFISLDAHADLRDSYLGSKLNHACVSRRAFEISGSILLFGVRDYSIEEKEFIDKNDLNDAVLSPNRFDDFICYLDSLPDKVYLSIDLDFLDPSIMPSVGTPQPGGLFWHDLLSCLKEVFSRKTVVSCDIVELCPIPNLHHPNFTASRLAYTLMGMDVVYGK